MSYRNSVFVFLLLLFPFVTSGWAKYDDKEKKLSAVHAMYCDYGGLFDDSSCVEEVCGESCSCLWDTEFRMLEKDVEHKRFIKTMLADFVTMPNYVVKSCPKLKRYLSALVGYVKDHSDNITENIQGIANYIDRYQLVENVENNVTVDQCKEQKQIEWFGFGKDVPVVNDDSVCWELVSKKSEGWNVHTLYSAEGSLYFDAIRDSEDKEYWIARAFRSDDKGQSWHMINKGHMINVFYYFDGVLYIGTGIGVHKSNDRGETWQRLNIGLEQEKIRSLFVNDTGAFYAGASYGLYISKNMGKNWTSINDGIIGPKLRYWQGTRRLSSLLNIEGVLYVCTGGGFGGEGFVFSSSDGGESWVDCTWSWDGGFDSGHVTAFYAVGKVLYAGTWKGLYRSDDGGKSWKMVIGLKDKEISTIHSIGNVLYVGSYVGVFRSDDGGESWVSINEGLPLNEHGRIVISTLCSLDGVLYMGTMDGLYRLVEKYVENADL